MARWHPEFRRFGFRSKVSSLSQVAHRPGAAPGSYPFTVVATPLPGANNITPVSLPVTLAITSAASAAWARGMTTLIIVVAVVAAFAAGLNVRIGR
jgi:hypothetical protein